MSSGKIVMIILAGTVALAVLGVVACAGLLYTGFKKADAIASPQIDSIFAAIEDGTFADTYETHTATELRQATPKEQYVELGDSITAQLGALQDKSLKSAKMRQFNTDSYVDVTYGASFEKGEGNIVATLKKEDGDWKILRFHVQTTEMDRIHQ